MQNHEVDSNSSNCLRGLSLHDLKLFNVSCGSLASTHNVRRQGQLVASLNSNLDVVDFKLSVWEQTFDLFVGVVHIFERHLCNFNDFLDVPWVVSHSSSNKDDGSYFSFGLDNPSLFNFLENFNGLLHSVFVKVQLCLQISNLLLSLGDFPLQTILWQFLLPSLNAACADGHFPLLLLESVVVFLLVKVPILECRVTHNS